MRGTSGKAALKPVCACHDWPLWSPRRLWIAVKHWLWLIAFPDEPVYLPLRRMLLYDNRPHAVYLAEQSPSRWRRWWAGTH